MNIRHAIIVLSIVGIMIFSAVGAGIILNEKQLNIITQEDIVYSEESNSYQAKTTSTAPYGSITLIDEGFESGFPLAGWTNSGWTDSSYGHAHSGSHWAYSWAGGDQLITQELTFGSDTELYFWSGTEDISHSASLEIWIDGYAIGDLVWYEYNFTHNYIEQFVDLSSYTGQHNISFVGLTSDFYGQILDDVLVTTIPIIEDTDPPHIYNIDANPNPQVVNGSVNITCDVIDDFAVDTVKVNITGPFGSSENFTMNNNEYFESSYPQIGTYEYFIWANDTSDNRKTSSVHTFVIEEEVELPPIEVEKYVYDGSGWSDYAEVYLGDIVYFKVDIRNPYEDYIIDFSGYVQDQLPCNLRYINWSCTIYDSGGYPNMEEVYWDYNTVIWRKPAPINETDTLTFYYQAIAVGCGIGTNNLKVSPDHLLPVDDCEEDIIDNINGSLNVYDDATVNVICIETSNLTVDKLVKIDCDTPYKEGYVINLEDPHWVTFNISFTSDGPFDMISVKDKLPNGFVFNNTWSVMHGWPIPDIAGDGTLYWNWTYLQESRCHITIRFRADIEDEFCDNVTNVAYVTGFTEGAPDVIVTDSAWVDVICDEEPPDGFSLQKLVKPDCEEELYDDHITFHYFDYDYVTYKIDVITDRPFLLLSIQDSLPQLYGLDFHDTYVEDGDGLLIDDATYDFEQTDDYLYWNFSYVQANTHFVIYYCANVSGCGTYINTVNGSGFYYDGGPCCPTWINKTDYASVTIICPSGISMVKQVSKDGCDWYNTGIESHIGDILWFKLTIRNLGFDQESGVKVEDWLPSFLEIEEVVDDDGAVDLSDDSVLRWFFQTLDGTESRVIIFKVRVNSMGSGENIACVSSCGNDPWCDSVWITADEGMQVEKLVSKNQETWKENVTVSAGDRVWWNLNISYYSEDESIALFDIVVKDHLPNGLSYVINSAKIKNSQGWEIIKNPTISNSVLTWKVYTYHETETVLDNGSWLSITFATDVAISVSGVLENWMNVTALRCNGSVVHGLDNAIAFIPDGQYSIECSKLVRDDPQDDWVKTISADIDDVISFNISIKNTASMPMYNIGIWDDLPDNLEYVDGSAIIRHNDTSSACEPILIGSNVLLWDDICTCMPGGTYETEGTYLMPGERASIIFDARIIGAGTAINEAEIEVNICSHGTKLECSDTASVDISIPQLIADAGNPYSGYVDDVITLEGTATGGVEPYAYYWDLDDDGSFDDATGPTVQHTWTIDGTYPIALKVIDDRGIDDTDSTQVTIFSRDSNLQGSGNLVWVNITPGDTVTGVFTIKNSGDPESELDWEIASYPAWGTWSFSPASGIDLTPEDGQLTVSVTVVVPDEKNEDYTGTLRVENTENPSDSIDISISLATPKSRHSSLWLLIKDIMQQFPIIQKIIQIFLPFL